MITTLLDPSEENLAKLALAVQREMKCVEFGL